ncbi:MAG: DUF3343 domain-containing protein [Clostridiaceae bacterium]|jgi:hypothetical protein|nr:DUF3343 domain-containing protein [Clostridiaceae bacterium]
MEYVATFHTHYGALSFLRRIRDLGDEKAMMIPAPRKLSVSCGSAVCFTLDFDEDAMVDDDTEGVYRVEGDDYIELFANH